MITANRFQYKATMTSYYWILAGLLLSSWKRPYWKGTADCNEAQSKDLVEPYLVRSWGTLNSLTGKAAALWVSLISLLCLCNGIKLGWDNAWVGSQAQRPHLSVQEVSCTQSSALLPSPGMIMLNMLLSDQTHARLTGPDHLAVRKWCRRSGHPLGSAGRFAVVFLQGISFSQTHTQ